ncbi:hypothetical protein FGG08_004470 [Glutinoglossum americanum]|uniref:CCHC-type domain-containing protein n=1 Tax=Glutinoglossum americanum TaxID=1670608 RepID=A0A9P8I5M1_9PEZI|nr:hypothetical protein FGG08_004470 [Glutinoglossum americanum]
MNGNGSGWNTSATTAGAETTDGSAAGVVIGDRPDIVCRKDCPEEKKAGQDGQNSNFGTGCFNCGEEGHSKADCTNPHVETRTCKHCQETGHIAKDCPTKPPVTCNNCKQEGHTRVDCKNNRAVDWSGIPEMSPEEAWEMLKTASAERDLFDFKTAVAIYVKALPDTTYKDLEEAFRSSNFKVYLIALEKEVIATSTLMNLQGKIDCKYAITYQFSANPRRESEKATWPASPGENLMRLEDAGTVTDRHIPMCSNCDRIALKRNAHRCVPRLSASTATRLDIVPVTALKSVSSKATIIAATATNLAIRLPSAPSPALPKALSVNAARKLATLLGTAPTLPVVVGLAVTVGKVSHGGVPTSRTFADIFDSQEGHKASDCTEPKNMDLVSCRNCEQTGHFSKDCPQPKDWSKVTCNNCGQNGHTVKRCKEPIKEAEDADVAGAGDGAWGEASGGAVLAGGDSGGDGW